MEKNNFLFSKAWERKPTCITRTKFSSAKKLIPLLPLMRQRLISTRTNSFSLKKGTKISSLEFSATHCDSKIIIFHPPEISYVIRLFYVLPKFYLTHT